LFAALRENPVLREDQIIAMSESAAEVNSLFCVHNCLESPFSIDYERHTIALPFHPLYFGQLGTSHFGATPEPIKAARFPRLDIIVAL
jgi:hypothetical protein